MRRQVYDWTCSVCATSWVLQSTHMIDPQIDQIDVRQDIGYEMGYPHCINETYGCMSSECVMDIFSTHGFNSVQEWVTFDEAYAICRDHTGVINPQGMNHYMAIRGIIGSDIWVANSAPGYRSVWDNLDRLSFNNLGPVQVVYLESKG